jgi:hypothetical protein
MAVTLNALTTGVGGLQTTGDTSGSISLQSNGSTVLAVTASGVTITGTLSSTSALPIASGGTGATSATAAFDALNPMTTTGDIIYESTPSVAARLPIGSTGQVLTVAGGLPSWATAAGGQLQTELFTAPGTWTKPASATQVKVTVIGGSGGAGANAGNPGGPGGLAGFAIAISPVSAPIAVTVGSGGISVPGGAGTSGGTSSFGALVTATGGGGGGYNNGTQGSAGTGTVSTGTALKTGSLTGTTFINDLQGSSTATGAREAKTYSTTSPFIAGAQAASQNIGGTSGAVVVEFVG